MVVEEFGHQLSGAGGVNLFLRLLNSVQGEICHEMRKTGSGGKLYNIYHSGLAYLWNRIFVREKKIDILNESVHFLINIHILDHRGNNRICFVCWGFFAISNFFTIA